MLLVTRPNHDEATNYLFYWTKQILEEAVRKNITVFDLFGKKASKKVFVSYFKKHKPKFLFFNGHGSESMICGYDNEVLIDTSDNLIKFENQIIVSRSCESARILGKVLVENGLRTFVGYINNYVVKVSKRKIADPLNDKIAALYLEPSNLIVTALLKGATVSEADKRSKKMLLFNLAKVLSSGTNDKEDIAKWLYHNYCNQVVIGDEKAIVV